MHLKLPTQLKHLWSPAKLGSTALVIAVGLCCYAFRFGAPLERLSFDLPFALRTNMAAPEAVLVYLDEESARQLRQSFNQPWDRALHTKLLDRLTRDGAKLVYYDIARLRSIRALYLMNFSQTLALLL